MEVEVLYKGKLPLLCFKVYTRVIRIQTRLCNCTGLKAYTNHVLHNYCGVFGECPPFLQFSPKVTICFKVIYFLTTRSHWVQLSNCSIYAIVHSYISSSLSFLVTQEFPVIVDSYWFNHMYNTMVSSSPRPIVTRLDNNTFPTRLDEFHIFGLYNSRQEL